MRNIELFGDEEEIFQGNACARILSDDGLSHELLSPLSGRIIQSNRDLLTNIQILEHDPHSQGWLYRIIPSAMEYEVQNLLPYSSERG